jgi:hypothetical protein
MDKAMADRMFKWLNYEKSKIHGHDVGADASLAESTPAHQLGLSEPVERDEKDDDERSVFCCSCIANSITVFRRTDERVSFHKPCSHILLSRSKSMELDGRTHIAGLQ